ncbi:MAG TPA: SIMPL domain-containing protein [Candidatus Eremiobacteraceae bacterium]|nr:SIMPL domain-containing protein [Candidatus Eremiobacteraceae bacterium]
MNSSNQGTALLGSLLAIGLMGGGWLLGTQIKATRLSDRYVTVKGLVERRVKSDLAIWPLSYKEAGDDLAMVYGKTEADQNTVLKFLSQQGIESSEIEVGGVHVVDTQANEYGGNNRAAHRYIAEQEITVRTSRVDQVAVAAQKTMQLLQKGIVLNSNALGYKFNGLNSIKPDMITEATRNARAAADRFATDSGSKVGAIRQANQGVFSITAANQGSDVTEPSEFGGANSAGDRSLMKTVRIVSSVQYYLEK